VSTDDFAGWLALQTNLALKGIIGINAMSELAALIGHHKEAKSYKACLSLGSDSELILTGGFTEHLRHLRCQMGGIWILAGQNACKGFLRLVRIMDYDLQPLRRCVTLLPS
jgi:hypothetical protein